MPGSFNINNSRLPNVLSRNKSVTTEVVNQNLQQELQQKFYSSNIIHKKTKYQHELLINLSSICYFLIFYQFSKYCHLACLIPFILHLIPLIGLNPQLITSNTQSFLDTIFENENNHEDRIQLLRQKLPKFCYMLYLKTIFVILYHILFICTWVVSLVNEEKLTSLQYGTWWFVSFFGEETPVLDKSDPFWYKVLQLGLLQIVLVDLIILFIQLILFQSIFYQSALFSGRRIEEQEAYLIRYATNSQTSGQVDDSLIENDDGILCALVVRLYNVFNSKIEFDSS
ncbi:hypothetical protein KGF54_001273 [Candida jiufengensis]|uniref:uncharacterized protein n=1 Tax=Candida jiufengensis TaxID=497108 RepID=UPI0022257E33|nr:uncharacterized protein KGF54_001273 [Candida jiufengensis]KAI5955771.1 hypothetical protein KGF54_001273 [Candida jiufengensis]